MIYFDTAFCKYFAPDIQFGVSTASQDKFTYARTAYCDTHNNNVNFCSLLDVMCLEFCFRCKHMLSASLDLVMPHNSMRCHPILCHPKDKTKIADIVCSCWP